MSLSKQTVLFLCAVACMAAATNVHDSIFNNFLADTFHLSAQSRGFLEFPRELPGFLAVGMAGILCMLPVTRVASVGALVFVVGMAGLAQLGGSFWPMVGAMFVGSCGLHLLMPVGQSVSLALSGEGNRGRRFALMGVIETCGVMAGAGSVWVMFHVLGARYQAGFFVAAALATVAAVFYLMMHVPHLHQPRSRLVVRKRFSLYYLLEFVFGARKQIFITFGPWVLIEVYGFPAQRIAALLLTAAVLGLAFKPLVGWIIDRFGERSVLVADGLILSVVCVGYGYALPIAHDVSLARVLACACFVADNLLFATGTARAVYASRLATSPQEVTSTLALGVSINHIVSMSIPALAGRLWTVFGYETVFVAAAVLALANAGLACLVPVRWSRGAEAAAGAAVEEAPA